MADRERGTVKWFNDAKGFGFITREGEEKDLFFHSNELVDVQFNDLREGDELTFEVTDGPKGPSATQVQKA